MVAEPYGRVNAEALVREWVRDTVPLVGRRAYFAPDTAAEAQWPQIVLFRIRGEDESVLIQFDIWHDAIRRKAEVEAVSQQLREQIDAVAGYRFENGVIKGASVLDVRWLPDIESGAARYVVEAYFTISRK